MSGGFKKVVLLSKREQRSTVTYFNMWNLTVFSKIMHDYKPIHHRRN
jgi:hypothetical protein